MIHDFASNLILQLTRAFMKQSRQGAKFFVYSSYCIGNKVHTQHEKIGLMYTQNLTIFKALTFRLTRIVFLGI